MNSNSDSIIKSYATLLLRAKDTQKENFMVIGQMLLEINENKLYQRDYITFDKFLKSVHIKRAFAYHALRSYREFGNYETDGIPYDRLVRLLPLKLDEAEKIKFLMYALKFTHSDFDEKVREKRGMVAKSKCTHQEVITKQFCKGCGKLIFKKEF